MSTSALHVYAAARELHATRANHLAIVDADIAAFWAAHETPEPDRPSRLARLVAERGVVVIVEQQAFEGLAVAVTSLVVTLPRGGLRNRVETLLDDWATERERLRQDGADRAAIDTAHRAMISVACDLLDPLVEQGSVFSA